MAPIVHRLYRVEWMALWRVLSDGGKENGVLNFRMASHTRDLIQFLSGAQVDEAVWLARLLIVGVA